MSALIVHSAGPAVSLQDLGRPGALALGLSRGGAMDRLALYEGGALLERPVSAAVEMIGFGGTFEATSDLRIALTGGEMQVSLDGSPLRWNASHKMLAGQKLTIGGVRQGAIGYLHLGAPIALPPELGSLSAHLGAGLGRRLEAGAELPLGQDSGTRTGWCFDPDPRFDGGTVTILRSLQSHLYGEATLDRFAATRFARDARANRQGIRLTPDGEGFALDGGRTVVSEIIAPGDIQITGDGAPYVLMCESQTTGGYPRLATVLPSDLPRVAQAPLGSEIRFRLLEHDAAAQEERAARARIKTLAQRCRPLIRDPRAMPDLLSHTLISGAISAAANPFEGDCP